MDNPNTSRKVDTTWIYSVREDIPGIDGGFGHDQGSIDHWTADPRCEHPMSAFVAVAVDDALEYVESFPALEKAGSRFDLVVQLDEALTRLSGIGATVTIPLADGWDLLFRSAAPVHVRF